MEQNEAGFRTDAPHRQNDNLPPCRDQGATSRTPTGGVRGIKDKESAASLKPVWIAARRALREVFEQVTITQLAEGNLPPSIAALTADEDAWQPH